MICSANQYFIQIATIYQRQRKKMVNLSTWNQTFTQIGMTKHDMSYAYPLHAKSICSVLFCLIINDRVVTCRESFSKYTKEMKYYMHELDINIHV